MTLLMQVMDGELDLLAIQAAHPQRYPFFLDSAAHGHSYALDSSDPERKRFIKKANALGRYTILFACPQQTLCLDSHWQLHTTGSLTIESDAFLDALDEVWEQEKSAVDLPGEKRSEHLPFSGGWFVFLAYELANEIEPVLDLANAHQVAGSGLPIAFATRIPVAIIVDHVENTSTPFAEPGFEQEYAQVLVDIKESKTKKAVRSANQIKSVSEEVPEKYIEAISRTHEYIYEGDIFQANLSREWQATFKPPVNATELYRHLRAANPGPFAGLVYYADHVIMSSSPERLLQVKGDRASTRPIAGTRPRGEGIDDDTLMRGELFKHPKERAEHIMLIDLERNDLGRICKAGSVEVDELMVIESYEHVHHIVSNVSGDLREKVTPGQAIKAVFPGGTITGCPKVRCMQIIAELEDKPREAYTGSMGYLNHNGDMDLNILIRTMHLQGECLNFRAGGGIVYDSDPEKEVQETRAKARGLIKALESQSLESQEQTK